MSPLEELNALVGEWTMEAGPADGPPWPGEARVAFEWLKGQTFLIERWTVPQAFDGIAIIGAAMSPAPSAATTSTGAGNSGSTR
jgi:hypothetical protein